MACWQELARYTGFDDEMLALASFSPQSMFTSGAQQIKVFQSQNYGSFHFQLALTEVITPKFFFYEEYVLSVFFLI